MRTSAPIITCDDEEGCDQWVMDWYEATADNWRDLMHGWTYNPNKPNEPQLCPQHTERLAMAAALPGPTS